MGAAAKRALWYHGGPRISSGSVMSWDRDRSKSDLNAEGPGMYFTTDFDEAAGYTHGHANGTIYKAKMAASFHLLPKKRPSLATLEALYELASPESQEVFLSNWSIEYPAPKAEVRKALTPYTHQDSLHDALVTLYHDLFRYDAEEYVGAMQSLGFDGVAIGKGTTGGSRKRLHLIVWNPGAMHLEEV